MRPRKACECAPLPCDSLVTFNCGGDRGARAFGTWSRRVGSSIRVNTLRSLVKQRAASNLDEKTIHSSLRLITHRLTCKSLSHAINVFVGLGEQFSYEKRTTYDYFSSTTMGVCELTISTYVDEGHDELVMCHGLYAVCSKHLDPEFTLYQKLAKVMNSARYTAAGQADRRRPEFVP